MTEFSLPAGTRMPAEHRWPMVMSHGHMVLRSMDKRDARSYERVRAVNLPWTCQWDATLPPGAEAREHFSYTQWIKQVRRQAKDLEALSFAIGWVDDPGVDDHEMARCQIIGQLSVSSIMMGSARSASIGYWVGQRWAGRGIAPAAVALAIDYLFQVVGLHRVEICIRPENAPSLRVVDKLGIRAEGLRERYLHINGEWRDHECFAVCCEEFPRGLLTRFLERNTLVDLVH